MIAPDKIYIPLYPNYNLDGVHLGDDWMYEPHKECDNVTYICKNTLLEWAEKEMMKAAKQSDAYGRRNAFMDVIDKINSL